MSRNNRTHNPTSVELRTLVPKQTHDMLIAAAKEAGLPVSTLVAHMLRFCLTELQKESEAHESTEVSNELGPDQDHHNASGAAEIAQGGGSGAPDSAPEGA